MTNEKATPEYELQKPILAYVSFELDHYCEREECRYAGLPHNHEPMPLKKQDNEDRPADDQPT